MEAENINYIRNQNQNLSQLANLLNNFKNDIINTMTILQEKNNTRLETIEQEINNIKQNNLNLHKNIDNNKEELQSSFNGIEFNINDLNNCKVKKQNLYKSQFINNSSVTNILSNNLNKNLSNSAINNKILSKKSFKADNINFKNSINNINQIENDIVNLVLILFP